MRPTYLVECYSPGQPRRGPAEAVDRMLTAARALRLEGHDVEWLDGMVLPSDDVVFHRFAGSAIDDIAAVCHAAGIQVSRITEYTELGPHSATDSEASASSVSGPGEIGP